ncbi:MAG: PEP-CTERM system TPR-repeat protein PrsT [Rubrivivax sp.]|nr:PEP-CTERM system TPR-repeat protein PrsT [Rubrivivax sp.]
MHSTYIQRMAMAAIAAGALTVLPSCGADSESQQIASAKSYIEKNDQKAAIIQLKSALQNNPQSGEARFLLGQALFNSGDLTAAIVELEKARDLKYSANAVLPLLAKGLVAMGQPKKVTDQYGQIALSDRAAAAELQTTVAVAYGAQGMIDRSQAAVNAALQSDPKNTSARLLQARLTARGGAVEKALALVSEALVDDAKRAEAWQLKGELLLGGKGDVEGGIKAFRDALVADPQYLPAHSALISMMVKKHDVQGFKAQVVALKKAVPNGPTTRFYETEVALFDGDLKSAREGAQQLLRFAPANARVLQLAGTVEFRSGALILARSHLNKALQLAPHLLVARRMLAETYMREGLPVKALSTLQPLLEQVNPDAESLALAAEAHLQNGDPAKSEAYFTLAAKANPADTRVQTALALSQISTGNIETGFAQLESLATHDPSSFADLALVSLWLQRNELNSALKAVDRLQGKLADKPLPYYLRGRILAQLKDTAGSRASFEKALAIDPVYFPAVAGLAAIDIAENRLEDARKRYEALLAREPRNFQALLAVADLRKRAGATPAEVSAILVEAVKLNPTEVAPRLMLIDHHLAQRDAKTARAVAQDAIAAIPDNIQLLDALGRARLAAGETQQAIIAFGTVAAAQPGLAQPHLRLADAYVQAKDYAAAARSLRRALEIAPNLLVAQRGLVQLALADKRSDNALAVARAVQKQRPTEAVGYLLEGEIESSQKRWGTAIAATRAALERSRTSEIAIRLHTQYVIAGRAADAERFAATWEHENVADVGFHSHLGSMAISRKDFGAAEARFSKVLTLRPDDALALNNLAWLMVQQAKPGAVSFAERANKLLPDQAPIMDTLASALAAENLLPKAIEWQRKAIEKAPAAPEYRLSLAKLLIKSGDKTAARSELESLAKLGGRFGAQAEVAALLKSL